MLKPLVFFGLFLFVLTPTAYSATLYIDPGVATLNRGDAVTSAIRLMPDKNLGECINAIDATISYSQNIEPVDVSIGKSIFSVWIEQPIINKENRTITFAGGIPNGYCGRVDGDPMLTNIIAEVIFRSPGMQVGASSDSNIASIDFGAESKAYLNDGQGTEAPLNLLGSTLNLEKTAGDTLVDDWRQAVKDDNVPPEEFSITLVRDENKINFNGKYFIVFSTSDKQTGISHYEVIEEPLSQLGAFTWGGADVPWVKADSPYVLKDQSLNSVVRVKAVDKAGNEYIATLVNDESLKSISTSQILTYAFGAGLIVVLIIVAFIIATMIRRRRKNLALEIPDESNNKET